MFRQARLVRCSGLLLLFAILLPHPVAAIDLGDWARHPARFGDWTALDFRDPATGLFLAARAGVEDPASGATLTVTGAPVDGCRFETVIVLAEAQPASDDREATWPLVLRVDGGQAQSLQAVHVRVRGDRFAFLALPADLDLGVLRRARRITFALPDGRGLEFSGTGMSPALAAAETTCRGFLSPAR